ncbi:uncharacterized protein [Amphiura filiformis]|uniref:uncharacterized protein n=1 Tax=Amphiura filiformis TaxID=82378 RepID=UPI003B20E581
MACINDIGNYQRCQQAVQLVCSKAVPCIKNTLQIWHNRIKETLLPCTTPQVCSKVIGKPKLQKSCNACIDWGKALECAVYRPSSTGSLPWSNVDSTQLYAHPIEAAKIFVLRLQQGVVDVDDFDSTSLIMIMMKFSEFHQGDMAKYDTIKKVSDIRNHLSHMKTNENLELEDTKTDMFFEDLCDFVTCLSQMHAQHLPQTTAQEVLNTLGEIRMDAFDIDLCRQELIRKYEDERGKVTLFPFDVDSAVDIDDVFVDLALLQESAKPAEVEEVLLQAYDELFSLKKNKGKDKRVLRVLLKGEAGSGKTTLVGKIAFDWAQGIKANRNPSLGKFDLLFSLKMRDFDQDMSLVDAIFDQLLPSDSKVSRRGLERHIVENAEKVAVILDGADEFSGRIEKSPQGNLVMDVVCNKMLCNSCVVVTSRPHKVRTVSVFSQYSHVRVIGFGESSILEFIGKFFQVKTFKSGKEVHEHESVKSEFKDKEEALAHDIKEMEAPLEVEAPIRENEESNFECSISETNTSERKKSVDAFITTIFRSCDLHPMSFVPVILTMLCLLWGEAQTLPTRFTTLFQEMFHYFIQRWYEKSDDCTDSEEFEKGILWHLGEVALKCMFEGRLYFTAGELNNAVILDQSRSIGFIKEETKRSKLRLVKQYSFFHLSFQEFCSAVYWTSLADLSDVKFMDYLSRVNSDNVESFEYVLLFCCGLSTVAASHILSHLVDIRSSDVTDGKHCEFDLSNKNSWKLGLRFLYESQCPSLVEVLTKWFQCKEIKITIILNGHNIPLERQVSFHYFIDCFEEHILSAGKKGLYSEVSTTMKHLQAKKDMFKDFFLRSGPVMIKTRTHEVKMIIDVLLKYAKHSANLKIKSEDYLDKTAFMTASVIRGLKSSFGTLHLIFASHNADFCMIWWQEEDRQWYLKVARKSLYSLGEYISRLNFGNRLHIANICQSPFDISPLLMGLVQVNEIKTIPSPVPGKVKRIFHTAQPSLIRELETNCVFTADSFYFFARNSSNLERLKLLPPPPPISSVYQSEDPQFLSLFGYICFFSSVKEFMSLLVPKLNSLTTLHLYFGGQSLEGTELQIVQFLSSLQDLALQNAAKDLPYWKSVFKKLGRTQMLLRKLCLMGNNLGGRKVESTIADFVHILPNMTHLQEINLSSTNLGPRDIELLSTGLASCSNLNSLNLSNNSIRLKEMHILSQSFHELSQLNVLDISDNPLRDLGLLALCNCFSKQGFQLQHLLLNNCGLSSTGLLVLSLSFQFLSGLSRMEIAQNKDVGPDGVKWMFENIGCLKNLVDLHLDGIQFDASKCDERLRSVIRKQQYTNWNS